MRTTLKKFSIESVFSEEMFFQISVKHNISVISTDMQFCLTHLSIKLCWNKENTKESLETGVLPRKVEFLILHYFVLNIWDSFREKGPFAYYKIGYKNALCLNRCNSRTVHTIDFLFATRHTTPFQHVKLHFGVLQKLCADVTRSDSPWGSTTPHLQVQASKSF